MVASATNHRLAELMDAAGLSNKALARSVRERSIAHGRPISCDHTSVARWLGGMQPREIAVQLIVEAISERTSRHLTPADLGLSGHPDGGDQVAMSYPTDSDEALVRMGHLLGSDLAELPLLVGSEPDEKLWSASALSWLVRPEAEPPQHRHDGRIGVIDVDAIRTTTEMFAALDNRFGGGHARRSLIQYLMSDVRGMLDGRYDEGTGIALFEAAAEALLLAAWMSYDAGIHGLAQRYFATALRLAQDADDPLLAGSILDAMSHQATFLGKHREAVNLARAARSGTRGVATATLTAHFHAMEARALAVAGDRVGADRAFIQAVRVFEQRKPGVDPEWISYVDDAELSAEFAHAYRDLGRGADAVRYAAKAITGASARSDFFVTLVSAAGNLSARQLEKACADLDCAMGTSTQLKSARCIAYLKEFRLSLGPFSDERVVQDLEARYADHPLWIAAS